MHRLTSPVLAVGLTNRGREIPQSLGTGNGAAAGIQTGRTHLGRVGDGISDHVDDVFDFFHGRPNRKVTGEFNEVPEGNASANNIGEFPFTRMVDPCWACPAAALHRPEFLVMRGSCREAGALFSCRCIRSEI